MEETNIQWHLGVKPAVDLELAEERASLSYFLKSRINYTYVSRCLAQRVQ